MTQLLSPKCGDAISAALRHIRDAEALLDGAGNHRSHDQAYHLAGFGPECARKGTLSVRWADMAIGHRFDHDAEVLDLIVALDPHAHRYRPRGWGVLYPALLRWSPNCRYERSGTRKENETRQLVGEAREAVNDIVAALWMDGRLPSKVLLA